MSRTLLLGVLLALMLPFAGEGRAALLASRARKPAQSSSEIAAAEAYSRRLDQYKKRNPGRARFLADVSNYQANEQASWRVFKNRRQLERADAYTTAAVWTRPTGEIVVADLFLTSPSGDWATYATYYFRDDGRLAKSRSELRTFMGDLVVIRERLYDTGGRLLRETARYLDLKTRRPKRVRAGDFMDVPAPNYAKTSELPFYRLLKKQ
ncbi:MAG TPA: hypothetical protein VF723_09790 [Pyrinomonadaceae bacterium]|jgi:hypothetical protein